MTFPPIAIIGQSCVVPGALHPGALWDKILSGEDLLSSPPENHWRLSPDSMLKPTPESGLDRIVSDRGGYVRDFEFDPEGFALPAEELIPLDPLFHWVLFGVRKALREAGHDCSKTAERVGLILGNLGYPSASLTRFAEAVWLDGIRPDPRNRFHLGLPPELAARALNLGLSGFSLDAACASSLYAIKLACDRLHDGNADLMVAGGVNRADDLYLHAGFTALKALSPTGQSLPFHRRADGLVPAEGAAFIVLKRLEDAVTAGDAIHGVIRGIGLSNDGRSAGLLAPAEEGQIRAMRSAYEMSGLTPDDISLVECHATGTPIGDAIEIRSMNAVFHQNEGMAIGSLKSNLGHLITASSAAGLLKLLAAIRAGVLPPMRNSEEPVELLSSSRFRLLAEAEPWSAPGPRRAALSGFGFGGNNAHLILEQWSGERSRTKLPAPKQPIRSPIGVFGIGVVAADCEDTEDFVRAIFSGRSRIRDLGAGRRGGAAASITLSLSETRFPPRDLEQTLGQQLLVLNAAQEAVAEAGEMIRERTGVFIGMECDPEVGRYGTRWRMAELMRARGITPSAEWLAGLQSSICPSLGGPAAVVGAMPNMPANRLNSQFDLGGLGFSIGAGPRSGAVALELAIRALWAGEIDAALVGAVDLSCEPVHEEAMRSGGAEYVPGDAAVVFVLRRLGAPPPPAQVYAVLDERALSEAQTSQRDFNQTTSSAADLTRLVGDAYAASGLLHVAAAALCCRYRAQLGGLNERVAPWLPLCERRTAHFPGSHAGIVAKPLALFADSRVGLTGFLPDPAPALHTYSGENTAALLKAIRERVESSLGPARLVVVAAGATELADRLRLAESRLSSSCPPDGMLSEGVYFFGAPVSGEIGFVFTGAAAAYRGMGLELITALPILGERLAARFDRLEEVAGWIFERSPAPPQPLEQLQGCSFLCQIHAELTMGLLGLKPHAVLGLSSGETNALFATGAWGRIDDLFAEIPRSGMYERELGGQFEAARRFWRLPADEGAAWANIRVSTSVAAIRHALENESRAHLLIIHAPDDCLIGGDPAACRRVLDALGSPSSHPAGHDLIVHCPEMAAFAEVWRKIHFRPTTAPAGIRFYSNALGDSFVPEAGLVADLLLAQASNTVDFPRTIEKAWRDGVRIFVEHGPRSLCSDWISKTLGDRPHLTVSLDRGSSLRGALNGIACLAAAGVPIQTAALAEQLARIQGAPATAPSSDRRLIFKAHPAPVILPPCPSSSGPNAEAESCPQRMRPAPPLPPILPARPPGILAVRPAAPAGNGHAPPVEPPASADAETARADANLEVLLLLSRGFAQAGRAAMAGHVSVLRRSLEARLAAAQSLIGRNAAYLLSPPIPSRPPPEFERRETLQRLPAIAPSTPPAPKAEPGLPTVLSSGLQLSREELEIHASGEISRIFGPLFKRQDGYRRQVRMPMPPLLLADRVTGIAGEPGVLGVGTVWTETDVRADSWFVHEGRMPAGIMIESGQADLLLISWQGIDFLNRDERVYRLLGCELTYHGGLPEVGDTLCFDIHIDSHAAQGDVRLFFFHYDCRINGVTRLSVRNGQAGFFTEAELANSAGVIWDPVTSAPRAEARVDAPLVAPAAAYSREQVRAFAEGRGWECFGAGYELAAAHSWSPRIPSGRMLLIDEVTHLEPAGGPWKRGYVRVVNRISPNDWYFEGHFKNDPCMPGTLMAEACQQAMAFYLAALGFTLERDGWRFEPVPEQSYLLRCRGQVAPSSHELVYEVFVEEAVAGPIPTLYADLLGSIDGVKAIHGRRMGVQLAPNWPKDSYLASDEAKRDDPRASAIVNGFSYNRASLLACAWGRPSNAFGEMYRRFDGPIRVPRLPCPPYHFITRVAAIEDDPGAMRAGAKAEMEYEIPPDAWYYSANGAAVMPLCVLMEAGLQPCGWLASYIGAAANASDELYFRNLDGVGTMHAEIPRDAGLLVTRTELTSLSQTAGMILVSFQVSCHVDQRLVFEMKTGFGFFPKAALANQLGLAVTDQDRQRLEESSDFIVDLRDRPIRYFSGTARLPEPMLLMIDVVTGYWPRAGAAGLGRLRAYKEVDPTEWFFKAHFFQDPVQPGSLGIEAMLELLQFYMLHEGLDREIPEAHFEPLGLGCPLTWKYRGQVVPGNRRVTVEMEIQKAGRDERGAFAVAEAFLWVDGKRIYHARDLTARISSRPTPRPQERLFSIDPAKEPWLADHCPTYTCPVLPMMDIVNRLAEAAVAAAPSGPSVVCLREVKLNEWVAFEGPRLFQTIVETHEGGFRVELKAAKPSAPSVLAAIANGFVELAEIYPPQPAPLPPLPASQPVDDPYRSGALFHGPTFHLLRTLSEGVHGASALLDAAGGAVPIGLLHPALLDASFHAIPNDDLQRWFPSLPDAQLGFPFRVSKLELFGPTPRDGQIRCEVRSDGFDGAALFPAFRIQLSTENRIWAQMRVLYRLVPKGRIGLFSGHQRRAFLRDRLYIPNLALSDFEAGITRLPTANLRSTDWWPAPAPGLYRATDSELPVALQIAIKEHVARKLDVHPSIIEVSSGGDAGRHPLHPLTLFPVRTSFTPKEVAVEDGGPSRLDLAAVRAYWNSESYSPRQRQLDEFLFALCQKFVHRVTTVDADALRDLRESPVLFFGNHQVLLESCLFSVLAPVLVGSPIVAMAKVEQQRSLLVQTVLAVFRSREKSHDQPIIYFDQKNPGAMLAIAEELRKAMVERGRSALVHVAGVRSLSCRPPLQTISGVLMDLAIAARAPIIPVRFIGGLPVDPAPAKLDFPIGYGQQDYLIGRPIPPAELMELPLLERKERVIQAINELGPPNSVEEPAPPDDNFATRVARRIEHGCLDSVEATLLECAGLPLEARITDFLRAPELMPVSPRSGDSA